MILSCLDIRADGRKHREQALMMIGLDTSILIHLHNSGSRFERLHRFNRQTFEA